MDRSGHWVHTWAAAPQPAEPGDLPPVPFVRAGRAFAGTTLRQTVRVSVGGTRLRLRLSNAYGPAPLSVGPVGVALPAGGRAGAGAIQPGSGREVTFQGRPAVTVPEGAEVVSDPFRFPAAARTNEHWYFLSGVEVWGGPDVAAAVVRVLRDGLGPSARSRVGRDVLGCSGVRWLVVFEGVNDIRRAEATEAAQKQVAVELIAAFEEIARRARAAGVRVYGATLAPFGDNADYDDPDGVREATRCAVNDWIRTGGGFDATLDFDRAVRDPADPGRLRAALDVGDHLHLNPAGHAALADAVPVSLFRYPRLPVSKVSD